MVDEAAEIEEAEKKVLKAAETLYSCKGGPGQATSFMHLLYAVDMLHAARKTGPYESLERRDVRR